MKTQTDCSSKTTLKHVEHELVMKAETYGWAAIRHCKMATMMLKLEQEQHTNPRALEKGNFLKSHVSSGLLYPDRYKV